MIFITVTKRNTMNQYKKLGKNVLLLLVSNFVTKILSFLMVPYYTTILSTSDYGIADLISTTVMLALPFFSLLMEDAILRFALDAGNDRKQVFSIAVTVSTVGFIIAVLVSPVILFVPAIKDYYWFVILYYASIYLYNIFSNYVKGLNKVSIMAIAGVIHSILYLGINILCLSVFRWGVYGYLLAIDLSNMITVVFFVLYCRLYMDFIPLKKLDWTLAKSMIKYSMPMIPNYISWWVNNASDRYILSMFCGTSVNGIYAVAYKIPTILNSVTSIFSSAWQISAVDNFGTKESIRFYNKVYRIYSGFLSIVASGLILITKLLAQMLFAKEFFQAWRITPILILSYIFSAQANFLCSIFMASKKTKKIYFPPTVGAVFNVLMNFILIPKMEGTGAAIATAFGCFTILIVEVIMTKKILNMDFGVIRNVTGYVLIIIEILSILNDSILGYIVALLCVIGIVCINIRELIHLVKLTVEKIQMRKVG